MFWNMDVGEQEQFLSLRKTSREMCFKKRTGWTFHRRTAPGFTGCMSVIQIMERICAVLWTGSFAWTRKSGKKFTKQ